ncbi:2OG-Fe(II) oxygenase [Nostoc sp. MBR 210]|nr:2OG-Fe(II) oxygenase [Nostoc sp. MBR 210]
MFRIPIIDLSALINRDSQAQNAVVKQIYQACNEVGFMYLQNHGISKELIAEVFNYSQHIFNLPLEVKQQIAWQNEFSNTGYVGKERERLNSNQPGDLKEAFNFSKVEVAFPINGMTLANDPCIIAFYKACTELTNKVLTTFALGLGVPEDFFTVRHNRQNHTLRLLHYPPIQELPKPGQVRAGEHSDYGSITLLFQDDVGGLEVQTKTGEWITAPTIPDTVIVNTGDLMQRWTNDVFCSTKHRVMIPKDHRVQRSRYSIAFFCHPNDDTEIACLETCQKEPAPIYPPILAGEYLLSRLQATY